MIASKHKAHYIQPSIAFSFIKSNLNNTKLLQNSPMHLYTFQMVCLVFVCITHYCKSRPPLQMKIMFIVEM